MSGPSISNYYYFYYYYHHNCYYYYYYYYHYCYYYHYYYYYYYYNLLVAFSADPDLSLALPLPQGVHCDWHVRLVPPQLYTWHLVGSVQLPETVQTVEEPLPVAV